MANIEDIRRFQGSQAHSQMLDLCADNEQGASLRAGGNLEGFFVEHRSATILLRAARLTLQNGSEAEVVLTLYGLHVAIEEHKRSKVK